jgi:tetratricopeptide (TPR) repeat protein
VATLASLLFIGAAPDLLAEVPGAASSAAKAPWQRLLQGDDARRADELEERLQQLREANQFAEALKLAQVLVALRTRQQGEDHWQVVDAQQTAVAIQKVLRAEKEARANYATSFAWQRRGEVLFEQGRYREAQPLLEKVLAVRRKLLGEEHPETASGYGSVAATLAGQGQYAAAEEGFRKALAIHRKVLGEEHPGTATSYNNLGLNFSEQGQYPAAEDSLQKALALRRKVLGEKHPDTARSYNNLAVNRNAQGQYAAAEEGFRKGLAIRLEIYGAKHPEIANSYNNLAANLQAQGRHAEAAEGYQKALTIHRQLLGEEHPETAESYNNLASNLIAQGRYAAVEETSRKALAIRRKALGEEHPLTANSYATVALNLHAQGQYAAAEVGYRRALDIFRKALGEEHPHTATSYNNLAGNLQHQGQYASAEIGLRRALDINRKVVGEKHPNTARSYNNLAGNLQEQGKYKDAEEAFHKALDIRLEVLGKEHPLTANSYTNLASNLADQGQHAAAEIGLRQALAIYRKVLGEKHPATATCYNNLAFNLDAQGRYAAGEEALRQALAIRIEVLGAEHPDTASSYDNLAANLHAQGRYEAAEQLGLRAAAVFTTARARMAHSGLERASITGVRSPLPHLAAVLARNGKPAAAWRRYEESLSRGTWDDLSARLRRPAAEQARQAALSARLDRLDLLLEKAVAIQNETAEQKQQRENFLDQRRKAQEELDAFEAYLENTYGAAAGAVRDTSGIQAALAADIALLGWTDLAALGPKAADPNGEHWAFLLRARGDPVCVPIRGSGTGGAWTEEDTRLPGELLQALRERRGGWQQAAQRLGKQRLGPLSKHLAAHDSLPPVRHLVVLPSPALAAVPVELLAAGYTVSYAHSGTLFAHLRSQPKVQTRGLFALADPVFEAPTAAAKEKALPPGGLLLTAVQPGSNAANSHLRPGDVLLTYNDKPLASPADLAALIAAAAGEKSIPVTVWRQDSDKPLQREVGPGKLGVVLADKPAPEAIQERRRLDRRLASRGDDGWPELPGTRAEVSSLSRLFSDSPPRMLTDSEASEQRLYELAQSSELKKYRYLHLATHGEVNDTFPLRSAVILSRDALPDPGKQLLEGKPVFDGRLTAEEVLRQWNLDCDLVTLSACQTALGKYERGEGFVGFTQALTLCGSRSVCLSLWKVDDAATALLMQRFYANLLGKREGLKAPQPKAEALADAKRWLRTLPREEALKQAAAAYQGLERGKGRPKLPRLPELPEPTPETKGDCPYAHPYYWAAFVLTGDPG